MDLKDIQNLIKFVAKSGVSEVKLEMKDVRISIRTTEGKKKTTILQPSLPISTLPETIPDEPSKRVFAGVEKSAESEKENTSDYLIISSPMIGTFFRRPAPDKPSFVNIGDEVQNDTVVCIIEAMKLFNEVEAEVTGKIVKVLVEDNSPVEFGQPLFLVDPTA